MLQISSVFLSLVYSVHAYSYYTVVLEDQRKYLCFIFIDETHVLHEHADGELEIFVAFWKFTIAYKCTDKDL